MVLANVLSVLRDMSEGVISRVSIIQLIKCHYTTLIRNVTIVTLTSDRFSSVTKFVR